MKRIAIHTEQKKQTKKTLLRTSASPSRIFSSGVKNTTKNVTKKTSSAHSKKTGSTAITKTNYSSFGRKVKRYAKQSVRSMLLSRGFHIASKVVSLVVVCSLLMYGSYRFIGKTFANEVVVSQSEIIARVAKLTYLPEGDPYEIVRVQDGEDLKKQNPFYKDIKEGDYILMYKEMAVIYDLRNNTIVNMKKVDH